MKNILEWNVANWITVVLMVALGYTALAIIGKSWHKAAGTGGPNA